jgi:hypothetical protein
MQYIFLNFMYVVQQALEERPSGKLLTIGL